MNSSRCSNRWLALGLALGLAQSASFSQAATEVFGTLRGRILDAGTGKPTPCTVAIIDANGQMVLERESFQAGFRCDGTFTKRLPAGPTQVRITRGFETRAVERQVGVRAGGTAELEVALERVVDLRRRHWYAGDSHVHMIHGEKTIPIDFDFVALTARAEDLQYLSLAQGWVLDQPTPERLQAELEARSSEDCVLSWNLEAPKNYYRGDAGRCLGHCWTVGMRGRTADGADVIDLLLQASAHDYESEKAPFANFESHQLIKTVGGSVFYTHPARWWTGSWGGQGGYPRRDRMRISNMAVELPLDVLVGPTFDGVDLMTSAGEFGANAKAFELWCLLLNHDYRLAGTASSDACFDRRGGAVPGAVRTYTYLEDGFSVAGVTRGLREGRNFVTSGPLLLVSLAGRPPGSALVAGGEPVGLSVQAWAGGTDSKGLTRLELLRNGQVWRTLQFGVPVPSFQTNLTLVESEKAWFCVRVFGGEPRQQRALSGAFFLDSQPYQPPPPVQARLRLRLVDAQSGERLPGSVTELVFQGPLPVPGATHRVPGGERILRVPATVRLRAEVAGYAPMVLSPILDHPELVRFMTGLGAEDLANWRTFEEIERMLGDIPLTFRLRKVSDEVRATFPSPGQ